MPLIRVTIFKQTKNQWSPGKEMAYQNKQKDASVNKGLIEIRNEAEDDKVWLETLTPHQL